ncbi:MAG: transglycosylase family protein [Chloroflexota bacterium]|nr:transglycosylase family protein [Chloroflexota bacterium]
MPVRSHRRQAVVIAMLAMAILLTAAGPQVAVAKNPPGLGKFMNAIAKVESGGRYTARNKTSGAYGKYQIMPSNWPAWARTYLGDAKAKQTPANQEKVAAGKFRGLYKWLGSWRRVAYWWLTGSSRTTGWSPYARAYVNKVMKYYKTASPKMPKAPGQVSTKPKTALHRYSEKNARISYTGTWKSARHDGYAGDAVKYATRAGSTATLSFTGKSVIWYGPVGPTRGKARISIDGKVVKTVDLHRSGFTAHAAVFRKTLTKGAHTLKIEVLGTAGHPMVALDEFVVR